MTLMLELSEEAFKITLISMLRAVIEKAHNKKEHISKVSREMETQRIKKKCYLISLICGIQQS